MTSFKFCLTRGPLVLASGSSRSFTWRWLRVSLALALELGAGSHVDKSLTSTVTISLQIKFVMPNLQMKNWPSPTPSTIRTVRAMRLGIMLHGCILLPPHIAHAWPTCDKDTFIPVCPQMLCMCALVNLWSRVRTRSSELWGIMWHVDCNLCVHT